MDGNTGSSLGHFDNTAKSMAVQKLVLCLVYEFQQPNSPFASYLAILPSQFDTLIYWADLELRELQGHPVLGQIGRREADRTFNQLLLPRIQKYKSEFSSFEALSDSEFNSTVLKEMHRCASIIMSYAFDVASPGQVATQDDDMEEEEPNEKALVPMADILNADADRANAYLFASSNRGNYEMRAIAPIPRGSEILNSYGPLPPAELARRYGYVTYRSRIYDLIELNPHELISAALAGNCGDEHDIVSRVQSLHRRDLWNTGDEDDDDEDTVELLLSFEPLGVTQPFQKPLLDVAVGLFGGQTAARRGLEMVLRGMLNSYSTTVAEDEAILTNLASQAQLNDDAAKGGQTNGVRNDKRYRMAVECRFTQKRLLLAGLEALMDGESRARKAVQDALDEAVANVNSEDTEMDREWEEELDDATLLILESERVGALQAGSR
jgi:SET domain-containing protein 6